MEHHGGTAPGATDGVTSTAKVTAFCLRATCAVLRGGCQVHSMSTAGQSKVNRGRPGCDEDRVIGVSQPRVLWARMDQADVSRCPTGRRDEPPGRRAAGPAIGSAAVDGHPGQQGAAIAHGFCSHARAKPAITSDLPGAWRARHRGRLTMEIGGASGVVNRLLRPESVRHMSVTTATQRLTAAHHETQRDKTERPASPGIPSSRAVSAGSGRCWVRTSVGLADGFTDRSLWPLGQPALCRRQTAQ